MASEGALLVCALSGQVLPLPNDVAVVTPSGYICSRRLLLTKLMETGGRDPLAEDRSLDESQLVELSSLGGTKVVVPPQLPGSSVPHLLEGVQRAHDATLLELFETRQVLQDTRRELSQALYQNDAALRVVARLSREREEARAQLREALSSRASAATDSTTPAGTKRRRLEQDDDGDDDAHMEPTEPTKEATTAAAEATVEAPPVTEAAETTGVPDKIPADVMDEMVETWKRLSKGRKKRVISEDLVEPSALAEFHQVGKKSLHKSSAKAGITSLCGGSPGDVTLTGGRDKQAVLYSRTTHSILQTLTGATGSITAVSLLGTVAATGSSDGMVRVYTTKTDDANDAEYTLVGSPVRVDNDDADEATPSPVVGVHVHPTGTFVVATCQSGRVVVCSLEHPHSVDKVAAFSSPTQTEEDYTCTALHPDGLILCAGTSKGAIRIWDLKGGTIAGSLSGHDEGAVKCLAFSNNGYHLAHSSEGAVVVSDLRKLKNIATVAGGASVVAFDASGKYLAFASGGGNKGKQQVSVVQAKEWDTILTTLDTAHTSQLSGLVWGPNAKWMATSSETDRPLFIWGTEK